MSFLDVAPDAIIRDVIEYPEMVMDRTVECPSKRFFVELRGRKGCSKDINETYNRIFICQYLCLQHGACL